MTSIREAREADKPRLLELAQHFLDSSAYGKLLRPAPGMVRQVIDLVFEHGQVFVAEVPDTRRYLADPPTVVGMLGVIVVPHPVTGEDFVDEVAWWVEPAWRTGTTGPRLLRYMEHWAVTQGLHMVKMVSPADAPDVGEFYRRSGYMAAETAWVKVLK